MLAGMDEGQDGAAGEPRLRVEGLAARVPHQILHGFFPPGQGGRRGKNTRDASQEAGRFPPGWLHS